MQQMQPCSKNTISRTQPAAVGTGAEV
jgi:hypothetical protein